MPNILVRARSFLAELKRRKVYRAAAVYLVVAIAGLELADLLIPSTRVPEWADELLIGIAIVGFPLIVVLAWVFDVTPEGVRKTGERAEVNESGSAVADASSSPVLDRRVVAVLPFENIGGAADMEPFAVGLHDDLLTELSRASALTVISRNSVGAYADFKGPLQEVANVLGVGTVVEGGVQTSGSRVRLNVRVTDTDTGHQRWAERYDRELSAEAIFDLQSELASRIMIAVEAELTAEEHAQHPGRPTDDLAAYRHYVVGGTHLGQWSEADLREAALAFHKAIKIDPGYALAWAGLADALSLLRWYAFPPVDGMPSPAEAADRALELGPNLAQAHLSRTIVLASNEMKDAPGALESVERAVQLQPSLAIAYIWMSWLQLLMGRPDEAVPSAERGVELDPLSPPSRVFLAEAYLACGRPEEALEQAARGRVIQPRHPLCHFMEALVLHHLGRGEDAERALDITSELVTPEGRSPTLTQVWALQAIVRAQADDPGGTRALLDRINEADDPVSSGLVHAALGETEEAFVAFERVEQWEQLSNEYLRYFFPDALSEVRASGRFAGLLSRVDRSWGIEP